MTERHVVRGTDIPCDRCKAANFNVETPGSETLYWLCCPNCGQYVYFVGNILCVDYYMGQHPTEEMVKRYQDALRFTEAMK